jgi:hypothetical protein
MSELLALAERCEKATGRDGSIDRAIFEILYPEKFRSQEETLAVRAPAYTASIDAAMTLAEGLRGLSLNRRSNPDMGGKDWIVSAGSNRSAARSWPLALCAVALRARAAEVRG